MQLSHAINSLEASVETQLRVAGPDVAEAGAQLLAALQPAIRQTLVEVATMAAAEVSSQLPTQNVDVRLVDGDPELVVSAPDVGASAPPPPPGASDSETRITLRLPEYLKQIIAEAAGSSGDSVNSYVVDALKTAAQAQKGRGARRRIEVDL